MRDGRDKDTVTFTELHLKLQKSSILKNREGILALFLNLSERTHRSGPKKVPPFASVSVSTVNGTVESGGVTVHGDSTKSFLASVLLDPHRNRPTTLGESFKVCHFYGMKA